MNENQIIESKDVRESMINRIEVLDKVGKLILLPNNFGATTEMVANYFELKSIKTLESLVKDHREELVENGLTVLKGERLSSFKKESGYSSRAGSLTLFSKRTILNVAMLLRDSEIAKEIRKQLLDVMETKQAQEEFIFNVDTEKKLAVDVLFADTEEDRMIAMAKYREYKNRCITQLEEKADFANRVGNSDTYIDMGSMAKILSDEGYKIGRNKLFALLRENKILMSNNQPYQKYIDSGHFIVNEVEQQGMLFQVTRITGKGQLLIHKIVKENMKND